MADTKISGLTAASALDGTEVFPCDQATVTKKATGAQIQTMVRRAGSATAGSWPILGSGTVLTAPVAGAEEYDGIVRYFSPAASSRAVDLCEYFVCLASPYTLTSTGNQQKLFNATAGGTITLPIATYFFEMLVSISSMSATSGNGLIDLLGAGNATVSGYLWHAVGIDGATATAAAQTGSTMITKASPASIVSATTGTVLNFSARGTFRVTGAGTMIPSITLVTAAAGAVAAGSYFRCRPVGSGTVTYCGNWS